MTTIDDLPIAASRYTLQLGTSTRWGPISLNASIAACQIGVILDDANPAPQRLLNSLIAQHQETGGSVIVVSAPTTKALVPVDLTVLLPSADDQTFSEGPIAATLQQGGRVHLQVEDSLPWRSATVLKQLKQLVLPKRCMVVVQELNGLFNHSSIASALQNNTSVVVVHAIREQPAIVLHMYEAEQVLTWVAQKKDLSTLRLNGWATKEAPQEGSLYICSDLKVLLVDPVSKEF